MTVAAISTAIPTTVIPATTTAVMPLVAMEVGDTVEAGTWRRAFVHLGQGTGIAATRIETRVDMTAEAAGATEPGACPDEDTTGEPFGTVIAVGRARIGCVVVVTVRTARLRTDIDAFIDIDLGGSGGRTGGGTDGHEQSKGDRAQRVHHDTVGKWG